MILFCRPDDQRWVMSLSISVPAQARTSRKLMRAMSMTRNFVWISRSSGISVLVNFVTIFFRDEVMSENVTDFLRCLMLYDSAFMQPEARMFKFLDDSWVVGCDDDGCPHLIELLKQLH